MALRPDTTKPRQEITRERLLAAASQVFAEKGFTGATTREIVALARVNIASLHYHFRDKRGLYLAVFGQFIDATLELHPLPAELNLPLPAEQRLAIFIETALRRLLTEDRPQWVWTLFAREMTDPTDAFELLRTKLATPIYGAVAPIVRELLGGVATDANVQRCCASILGQCFIYRLAQPLVKFIAPDQALDESAVHDLAAHITRMSLGGIEAIRNRAGAT